MLMVDKVENIAFAYGLKNALSHEGKCQQGAVVSGLFASGIKKQDVKKYIKLVNEVVNKINSMTISEQNLLFPKYERKIGERPNREGLAELDKVGKSVVMRFSPSASGPMHIGHAITASLNYLYVKKYKGKFYLRIEDTNPENSFIDSYKLLEDDAKWLTSNDKSLKIEIQSYRMDIYYKYLETLLKKGSVYVCTCDIEKFKELVTKSEACHCRNNNVKENLLRWNKMLGKEKNSYKDGGAVVRFKSDLKNKNPAFRDFPLARINTSKHPLQNKKYKVWPLMNLAVSVDDIEFKVTHIIRGKDHRDNAERQKLIFKALGKKYPESYFHGKIHFKDLNLSTSEMRRGIESKKYKGWDDVKLPTLISLRKRGYKPDAFLKLTESMGLSEVDKVLDKSSYFELLDTFNKK